MPANAELTPPQGWILTDGVRIPPPPPAERGLGFRMIGGLARFMGRDQVPDIFTVLQIHGRLFWAWLFFASRLMPYGKLSARTRELIILRTGWNCRCRYEWGQHVEVGLRSGVTDEDILNVSCGPEAFADAPDRAAMFACDELCTQQHLSDATWELLKENYSTKLAIEIMILTGHYVMLAGFLNSTGIRLEASIEGELAAFNQRVAH